MSCSFFISRLFLIPAYTQMGSSVSGVQSAFNRLRDKYVGVVEELDAMKKERRQYEDRKFDAIMKQFAALRMAHDPTHVLPLPRAICSASPSTDPVYPRHSVPAPQHPHASPVPVPRPQSELIDYTLTLIYTCIYTYTSTTLPTHMYICVYTYIYVYIHT